MENQEKINFLISKANEIKKKKSDLLMELKIKKIKKKIPIINKMLCETYTSDELISYIKILGALTSVYGNNEHFDILKDIFFHTLGILTNEKL